MSSKTLKVNVKPSGKQIRKAMIDLNLTPLALAHTMGVSVIYIRYIMQDRRVAGEMRSKIAKYLRKMYKAYSWEVPAAFQGEVKQTRSKEKAA
jgi:plasmid maintenance system antidote protein VapI